MLIGDINARTANLADFTPPDDFLADYFNFDDETVSLFHKTQLLEKLGYSLTRTSQDSKTNAHGLMLIELCENNNMFILNRRVGHDNNRERLTYRDTSVIDYVCATPE